MRWSKRTDLLAVKVQLTAFVAYLVLLSLFRKNNIEPYLRLQFIVFIFVCAITSAYFEETFRKAPFDYIRVMKPGMVRAVLMRYVRLLVFLEAIYLPVVLISFISLNHHYERNSLLLNVTFPQIDLKIPLIQCAIAMLFYVTVTLFFMMIFKNSMYLMVSFMAYSAFEATIMPYLIGDFVIFRGAFFTKADYTVPLPPNIALMLVLSLLMLIVVMIVSHLRFGSTSK